MRNQSTTITGIMVAILVLLFEKSGIEVAPDEIQTTITVLVQLGALVTVWVDRFKKGDVTPFGRRK